MDGIIVPSLEQVIGLLKNMETRKQQQQELTQHVKEENEINRIEKKEPIRTTRDENDNINN